MMALSLNLPPTINDVSTVMPNPPNIHIQKRVIRMILLCSILDGSAKKTYCSHGCLHGIYISIHPVELFLQLYTII